MAENRGDICPVKREEVLAGLKTQAEREGGDMLDVDNVPAIIGACAVCVCADGPQRRVLAGVPLPRQFGMECGQATDATQA